MLLRRFILVVCFCFSVTPMAHAATALPAQQFLDDYFGVNLHLDNCCGGRYYNLERTIKDLRYLGVTRLRGWATTQPGLLKKWQRVHAATGAPFHVSIPMASPRHQRLALGVIADWLQQAPGMIDVIEGGNEEDSPHARRLGATLADTAAMQHQVYALGKKHGVAVAQMSVGEGWEPPHYEGNYKKFGKPPADYGNAHVYMMPGHGPSVSLRRIGDFAAWSVDGKPVDVTEFGSYQTAQQPEELMAGYFQIAPFISALMGHKHLIVYALYDDGSNTLGFYDRHGKARAHAHYWHKTTRLLADPAGKALKPRDVAVQFLEQRTAGKGSFGLRNLPLYKADGSLWIAMFDEAQPDAPAAAQTVQFDRAYPFLTLVDGRTGKIVRRVTASDRMAVTLPGNHLFFLVASEQAAVTGLPAAVKRQWRTKS